MVAVCDPDTMIGVRNRALLLVGFAGGFRRSELVAVDVHHLEAVEAGIRLYVPSSKTDQAGRGDTKALPYGSDPSTCPVTAVRTWLERSGIVEGPVFRRVRRGGAVGPERLSDRSVARLVDALAAEAGLPPGRWSGHSLRSGFVTVAAARGASERSIARQTGHAPGSAVLRTYVRHSSVFTDNAATHLGL
jgi:integrase